MAKLTPGPWKLIPPTQHTPAWTVVGPDHQFVAQVITAADALLVTAALELRGALAEIVEAVDSVRVGAGERFHMTTDLMDAAREALAKAGALELCGSANGTATHGWICGRERGHGGDCRPGRKTK